MANRDSVAAFWISIASKLPARFYGPNQLRHARTKLFTHNFYIAMNRLKLVVFEDGEELTAAQRDADYLITQVDLKSVNVKNISGQTKIFDFLINAFPLKIDPTEVPASARSYISRSASFETYNNETNIVDTSTSEITATMPVEPSIGDVIEFFDDGENFETNKLILIGSGKKINGLLDPFNCDRKGKKYIATYLNASFGWAITN